MKKGFTLIEVVFSVVILGIVVTAIPALLTTTSNSMEEGMKQESFKNAFATLELAESVYWDENNTKSDNYYKVLTADGGDDELKCTRKGKEQINNGEGRSCATDDNKTSSIGIDDGEDANDTSTFDDLDDFDGYGISNLEKYDLNVSVSYVKDDDNYSKQVVTLNADEEKHSSSNIKLIKVDVYYKNSNKKIALLKYFSSNIGLNGINGRDF